MAAPEVPDDPLSRLALSVFTVNGLLMRSGELVTRPVGQSSARWQVLGRAGYQPQTVAQMAHEMGHARQSVQRIADALARDGLITYTDNPADKRARLVELSSAGEAVLTDIYERDAQWSQQLMAQLDPRTLLKTAEGLDEIAAIFEAHLDRPDLAEEQQE